MKTAFKRPEDSPGFLLWKLTTEWQRQIREALEPFKITHAQFVFLACLQWLSLHEETITQSQLAAISKLDKMVVSETAQKLLKKHLIARSQHKEDSRAYALKLTEKGKNLIDQALPMVEAVDKLYFYKSKKQLADLSDLAAKIKIH